MVEAVAVVRDVLYLVENQIPFFVVDKIHRLTVPNPGVSVEDAIAGHVRELLRWHQYSVATPAMAPPGNLLHLLHMHFRPTVFSSHIAGGNNWAGAGRWRSATDYHSAGVRFRSVPLDGKEVCSILDVKLDGRGGGTLEVPRLSIDADTVRLLHNLMALEQSNPAAGSYVTAYCVFLSHLACTAQDVEFLCTRGVIAHSLRTHGVAADRLAGLCKNAVLATNDPGSTYLRETWMVLDGRFRSRPRLLLTYLSNPWLGVGHAVAAVGLISGLVQAVYSVLSYSYTRGAT